MTLWTEHLAGNRLQLKTQILLWSALVIQGDITARQGLGEQLFSVTCQARFWREACNTMYSTINSTALVIILTAQCWTCAIKSVWWEKESAVKPQHVGAVQKGCCDVSHLMVLLFPSNYSSNNVQYQPWGWFNNLNVFCYCWVLFMSPFQIALCFLQCDRREELCISLKRQRNNCTP